MRKIDTLIVHTSATFPEQRVTVETIRQWHLARGFSDIGYHFVVDKDGTVYTGRPAEQPGAHTLHWNSRSLGLCYIGGLDEQGRASDTEHPNSERLCVNSSPTCYANIPTSATSTDIATLLQKLAPASTHVKSTRG